MRFWVLESAANNYAQVHWAECEHCRDGQKPQHGSWTGFDDYTQAMEHAAATGRPVLQCALCHPERHG